jgi:hypothetical protein
LGRWILWYFDDVRTIFGKKANESPNFDDIHVFQHVLCDYVYGGVSDTNTEWS